MKNIRTEDGVTGLEALSTLSGFKGLNYDENFEDNIQSQELLNENTFNHFKLR